MGIRDFVRDGRDISSFHFNEEASKIEAEGNKETFREETREIIKEVLDRDRMRSYNLNHGDTSYNMVRRNEKDEKYSFSPFLEDYTMN